MISVIVPARNAENTIAECVRAVLAQSGAGDGLECIVADDGSTDGTGLAAEAAGARVVRQPPLGPAAARNLGIATASGDPLLFTDADCRPAPDWVAQMCRPFENPEISAVKGTYSTDQREVVARLAQLEFEERYDRLERARAVDFFDTHAAAIRCSVLRESGAFDTFFPSANNEDVDLAYRLASSGKRIAFNRKAIVFHRHAADWAHYARLKFWRGYWRMQVYRRYPGKMVADSYTPQSLKAQIAVLGLFTAACAGTLVLAPLWWVAALLATLWLASGASLYRVAWQRDPTLLPLVPLFLAVRAAAIGGGILLGALTIAGVAPLLTPRTTQR